VTAKKQKGLEVWFVKDDRGRLHLALDRQELACQDSDGDFMNEDMCLEEGEAKLVNRFLPGVPVVQEPPAKGFFIHVRTPKKGERANASLLSTGYGDVELMVGKANIMELPSCQSLELGFDGMDLDEEKPTPVVLTATPIVPKKKATRKKR
jgi:hypothetical protein